MPSDNLSLKSFWWLITISTIIAILMVNSSTFFQRAREEQSLLYQRVIHYIGLPWTGPCVTYHLWLKGEGLTLFSNTRKLRNKIPVMGSRPLIYTMKPATYLIIVFRVISFLTVPSLLLASLHSWVCIFLIRLMELVT